MEKEKRPGLRAGFFRYCSRSWWAEDGLLGGEEEEEGSLRGVCGSGSGSGSGTSSWAVEGQSSSSA